MPARLVFIVGGAAIGGVIGWLGGAMAIAAVVLFLAFALGFVLSDYLWVRRLRREQLEGFVEFAEHLLAIDEDELPDAMKIARPRIQSAYQQAKARLSKS